MILQGRLAEDTARWQADGKHSAALYRDVQLAAARQASLLRAACGIAEVSLTRQQWADYAGTQPFRQVCPAG